ncbi:hypothetical protein LA664_04430 [Lactobacillus amylolyticus]|uniref:Uncharacterized protein n=1 Tax=Lactobacillus amylolyticus DSM 11664 TaxID=585524 RepID=D4YU25_9LACO|nr:hypothetical protein [Lactobacillus amylolyticus]EFG55345.1 hypothetical protein HMPREF0493_1036 [Lactobacillus amylolyticus DSM 11664]QFY04518.1 hypothetical protein LA664_04430 [Lactobacillus amylolyticus]
MVKPSFKRPAWLDLIIKVNPDYLPTYHGKISAKKVDNAYVREIVELDLSGKFHYQVLSGGVLQLKW